MSDSYTTRRLDSYRWGGAIEETIFHIIAVLTNGLWNFFDSLFGYADAHRNRDNFSLADSLSCEQSLFSVLRRAYGTFWAKV